MLPARTFSIAIDQDWQALYDKVWQPEFYPRWASGLARSGLRKDGDRWIADGPDGPIHIRFTPHNRFGVMDHYVDLGADVEIYVPLRIIQNGNGAEVMLTLFHQPDMDAERFSADIDWVNRDLQALKRLVEQ